MNVLKNQSPEYFHGRRANYMPVLTLQKDEATVMQLLLEKTGL